jgi:predicted small secreted protein
MQTFSRICLIVARAMMPVMVLVAAMVTLGACNTTAGVGQDVSAAGHAVTNSADKVKQGL